MAPQPVTLEGYDPVTIQPWLERVMVSMSLFALLITGLRVRSRLLNRQEFGWDDWLAIFNMGWMLIIIALIAWATSLSLGMHITFVLPDRLTRSVKIVLTVDVLYIWSLVFSKLSLLFLYHRVFCFGYFKRAGLVIGGLVVVWAISATFLACFHCIPLRKVWRPEIPGHCMSDYAVRLYNSSNTIATDVMILCLPIPQIWALHGLKWPTRAGLTLLFVLGLFVVFTASYRITVYQHDDSDDESYTLAPDAGWLVIEITASIVSASLPTIGPALVDAAAHIMQAARRCVGCCAGRKPSGANERGKKNNAARNGEPTCSDPEARPNSGGTECSPLYALVDLKRQSGSTIAQSCQDAGQPSVSRETVRYPDKTGSAAVRSDGAHSEVSLHPIQKESSVS